jgi:myo-inositol catabolism protein IolC
MEPDIPAHPLYFLAFDHRATLRQMLGEHSPAAFAEMKALVLDGLLEAREQGEATGSPIHGAGILIDGALGEESAVRAKEEGLVLAMPIERSGAPRFELEFGAETLDRLDAMPIDYAKALVALNPESGEELYDRQIDGLAAALSDTAARGHDIMLEVLVPPTEAQLEQCGGDRRRFDGERRPELLLEAIAECYEHGIAPTLWKIEGLESSADARMVADFVAEKDEAARSLVLGRWEAIERVEHWLRVAAGKTGFDGLAIGRNIWEPELREHLEGGKDREAAVAGVARRYLHFVDIYDDARPVGAGSVSADD